MRQAVSVPPFGPFADPHELAALAAAAEVAGWDGFFIWDHVVFDPTFHPIADPWVALAAVALSTSTIRLGTMVTPVARRRPWQLARQAVMVDLLSRGRLVLGVGLGDPVQWDFGFFGESTDARVRAERLDEGLDILAGLWSGQPFSYAGRHYTLSEVVFAPIAVQRPRIPVWVGGWWPHRRPLRRAARWDGLALARWGEPLTPVEVAAAIAEVQTVRTSREPFDVAVNGSSDPDRTAAERDRLADIERAGATWWVEDVSPWRFGADWESSWQDVDTERMRERVARGPL